MQDKLGSESGEILVRNKLMSGIAGAAFSFAASGFAFAADIAVKAPPSPPPATPYSWTGCYAGINGGGGWVEHTGGLASIGEPDTTAAAEDVAAGAIPSFFGLRPDGALGGGQIGCDWQTGIWVLGGEADIQAADIGQSRTFNFPGTAIITPVAQSASEDLHWFGTVRARLGWLPLPQWLLYATGGLAYGSVHDSASLIATPAIAGTFVGSESQTRVGWTAGAGTEFPIIFPNLTFKAEYLYMDLGKSTVTLLDPVNFPGDFINYIFPHRVSIVRAGLNYRFW
jgi:outer membrane immunogenic protein